MDINARVKRIRKAKELSQEEFGKSIGLSSSCITEIEKGRRPVTERSIMLICSAHGIDEGWLRTGEGDIFVHPEKTIIEKLSEKYTLDDMDCSIIECYMKLPPSARAVMKAYLRMIFFECAKHDANKANALLYGNADGSDAESKDTKNNSDAHA